MAADIATTLNQIMALPVKDQIEVLHQAWDRLVESGWEPELSDGQKAEFDRRLDDLNANPQNVVTLEKLVELSDKINVIAVQHGHRHPRAWRRRA